MNPALADLALQGLETACNQLLAADPYTAQQLAANHGRCIGIDCTSLPFILYCVPDAQGHLQLFHTWEGTLDCLIQGTLPDLLQASQTNDSAPLLFSGRIRLSGNIGLGQRFSQALSRLQIDWEEHLSHWIGDAAAYQVGDHLRQARQRHAEYRTDRQQNLADYLTEELRLTPHQTEMHQQSNAIHRLRDDIARLEARLTYLETSNL